MQLTGIYHRYLLLAATIFLHLHLVSAAVAELPATNATNLLQRQKRYLIFEKGSTFFVQGNIAKAILGTTPRGLNEISEWTWTYALPTSLDSYSFKPKSKQKKIKPKLNYATPTKCSAYNLYKYTKHQPICQPHTKRRYMRELAATKSHSILLDVLSKWAEIQNYQARYCIMRTLCEMQHLLLPEGHSMFHDVLRILLSYAEPIVLQNINYRIAFEQKQSLHQCQTLYGPYCRISFLQHFTPKNVL